MKTDQPKPATGEPEYTLEEQNTALGLPLPYDVEGEPLQTTKPTTVDPFKCEKCGAALGWCEPVLCDRIRSWLALILSLMTRH